MSRLYIPFSTGDISALARSLKEQLGENDSPGHVELLNMLARAIGHRNFQSLRAQQIAGVELVQVQRVARFFDPQGRLASWPSRSPFQELCRWATLLRPARGARP